MAGATGEQDWYLSGIFALGFLNLDDTFGDYVDRAGKVPKVNSEEDALAPSDTSIDAHADRHEDGGADEVTGITSKLNAHADRHEDGGADEVTGITSKLNDHSARHESGGADEINGYNIANCNHVPTGSTNPGLGFDTWRTPNSDRPTFVLVHCSAQTDGSTFAAVILKVDESGGTSADYDPFLVVVDDAVPGGTDMHCTTSFIVPPGASYQIYNYRDPNSKNQIGPLREMTL